MSIFNFGKKETGTTSASNTFGSTQATSREAKAKITLEKAEAGLERHIVSLKKEKGVDLSKHQARVVVVIDRSGSMSGLYDNGSVQTTLTRLLPLGLRFDDNGEVEVYSFSDGFNRLKVMSKNNFDNYVEREMSKLPYGGTNYAPVLKQILKDYNDGSQLPTFVIFITDGSNWDTGETDKIIRKSSKKKHKLFVQFVGIGNDSFSYLRKLDDLDGRDVDNTAFIAVQDLNKLTDDELYAKLLEQYVPWLKELGL